MKIKKLLSSIPPPINATSLGKLQPPSKKRKVESIGAIKDEDMSMTSDHLADPFHWLSLVTVNNIILTEEDREIVFLGEELNDKHINFVQAILKKQFDGISGLQSTLLLSGLQSPLPHGALQIVHVWGNHWIVTSIYYRLCKQRFCF